MFITCFTSSLQNLMAEKYILNFTFLKLATYAQENISFSNLGQIKKQILIDLDTEKQQFAKYLQIDDLELINKILLQLENCPKYDQYFNDYIVPGDISTISEVEDLNLAGKKIAQEDVKAVNSYNLPYLNNVSAPYIFWTNKIYCSKILLGKFDLDYLKQLNNLNENLAPNSYRLIFFALPSTNLYIEEYLHTEQGNPRHLIIIAMYQYRGIGRNNKNWLSLAFADLACSVIIPKTDVAPSLVNTFALHIANCLHTALAAFLKKIQFWNKVEGELEIKWPNDIYLNNQKLSGILITLKSNNFIIGFGINFLAKNKNVKQSIDQATNSILTSVNSEVISIPEIVTNLQVLSLSCYQQILANLTQDSFDKDYFAKHSYFKPKQELLLTENNSSRIVSFIEVDQHGYLQLEEANGNISQYIVPNVQIKKLRQ